MIRRHAEVEIETKIGNHTLPREAKKSLDGKSFTSVQELVAHLDAFIADYNQIARLFVWT